jgi:flavin reductase (DIM6/NTAB) family NADH-FMN oxidoreductase RutF
VILQDVQGNLWQVLIICGGTEMGKISLGTNVYLYPMAINLIGTKIGEKVNFMAVGFVSRLDMSRPLIGVSINREHETYHAIMETKEFSINVPSADLVERVDYCGLVSGKDVDKTTIFDLFYGTLPNAPMIQDCPVSFECKVVNTLDFGSNTLVIGEIVSSYADEQSLTDGRPDVKKFNPILLTMPDNRYWTIGEYLGDAWKIGRTMI